MKKKLVLASGSPRRREILQTAGYDFLQISPDAEEIKTGTPEEITVENSLKKAKSALKENAGDIYICADTVVALDGEILGKPHTKENAEKMLKALSGKAHLVITGYTVTDGEKFITGYEKVSVFMREIYPDEMKAYIDTGSPLDKAGAYGIQEAAGMFVSKIDGDYYTVMGLPLCKISEILRKEFNIFPLNTEG